MVKVFLAAALLGNAAGKHRLAALRRLPEAGDHKTHRLIDAGDQNDILRGPLGDAESALAVGDQPLAARKLHIQVVIDITAHGAGLQQPAVLLRLHQRGDRADGRLVLRCVDVSPLRLI